MPANTEPEQLGSALYKLGILRQPELLRDTVIELDDEVEYIIPLDTAKILSETKETSEEVTLIRLIDHKEHLVPTSIVQQAINEGTLFDQLSDKDEAKS